MVGSTIEDSRDRANRLLQIGFVLLVGGSAGLMAIGGGATLVEVAGVVAFGLGVGAGLLWYLRRVRNSRRSTRGRRRP